MGMDQVDSVRVDGLSLECFSFDSSNSNPIFHFFSISHSSSPWWWEDRTVIGEEVSPLHVDFIYGVINAE